MKYTTAQLKRLKDPSGLWVATDECGFKYPYMFGHHGETCTIWGDGLAKGRLEHITERLTWRRVWKEKRNGTA